MKKKKLAKKMLKKAELKLRKVRILPDNLLYVSIYQNLCNLVCLKKYDLSIDMSTDLIKELEKVTN